MIGAAVVPFRWLVETSFQAAVLIVLALCVHRWIHHRLSPRWTYTLWLLVLVRLVIPGVPEVRGGFSNASMPGLSRVASPEYGAESRLLRSPSAAGTIKSKVVPPSDAPNLTFAKSTKDRPLTGENRLLADSAAAPVAASTLSGWDFAVMWAVLAWASVALLSLLRFVWMERKFRHELRGASLVTATDVCALLDRCRDELGVSRRVTLIETQLVTAPAVFGLTRPCLLVPMNFRGRFSDEEIRHVFRHELAHVRRRDVFLNIILVIVQSVYWFHPLVHLALSRLRLTRELVRDEEAVSFGSGDSLSYAKTLLKFVDTRAAQAAPIPAVGLFDGTSDIKRRVLMITDCKRPSRRSLATGFASFVMIGWVGFTSASSPVVSLVVDKKAPARREIQVERFATPSEWKAGLMDRLENSRVVADWRGVPITQVVKSIGAAAGLNVVVLRSIEDYIDDGVTLQGLELSGKAALDLVTQVYDSLGWVLYREAIVIGPKDELPGDTDLRFYNLAPILETFEERGSQSSLDDVLGLTIDFSMDSPRGAEVFQRQDTYVDFRDNLLLLRASDDVHEHVLAFLNHLLNFCHDPDSVKSGNDRGDKGIDHLLASKVSVDFQDLTLYEIAEYMQSILGVPVIVGEDYQHEEVTLQLKDVSAAAVLEFAADLVGCGVGTANGVVRLGAGSDQQSVRLYDVRDLLTGDFEDIEGLVDLVRENIQPRSWDEAALISGQSGILFVRQTKASHDQLGALLAALRRALGVG